MKIQNKSNGRTLPGGLVALAAGAACMIAQPASADYASEILSDNPLAYYRFDDGVATDDMPSPAANIGSAGTTVNGSYTGNFVRGVPGALVAGSNTAVQGSNTLVSIPYDASINNAGSFSVEAWLKPTAVPATGALISPIASFRENDGTFGRAGWLIYQGDAGTGFNFRCYNRNGSAFTFSISTGAGSVTAGAWHHVVASWDSTTNQGKLYLNGVLKSTSAVIAPSGLESSTYVPNNSRPLTFGSRDGGFPWSGDIDEVAYYTSALSGAQVADHYNNGASASPSPAYDTLVLAAAPVGYWRLGEAAFVPRTPPVANNEGSMGDSADGAYHAGSKDTSTGPASSSGFLGFGVSNSALSLPDANGYVGTSSSMLNGKAAFTICGWLKRGAVKSTNGGYFGQNDLLEFGDSAGTSIAAWNANSGTVSSSYSIPDGVWGFVAVTGDSTATRLFVNGVNVQSIGAANLGSSSYPFNIGGLVWAATGGFFRGEIDEVAVFDKSLSPERIQTLYDTALGNVPPAASAPTSTPASGIVLEGKPFSLEVTPTGTPPFAYQWIKDGVDIPGATSRTYSEAAAVVKNPVTDPYEFSVRITGTGASGPESITTASTAIYVDPVLVWTGNDSTNPTWWNINTTANWKPQGSSTPLKYLDDASVVFDNSGVGTLVEIQTIVIPRVLSFDFDTPKQYTLSGASGVICDNLVSKSGTGTLTLNSDNIFSGPVSITGGTVEVSSAENLGGAAGMSMALDGGTIRATASHTLARKPDVPAGSEGMINVDSGVQLMSTGGLLGGGTLVKLGAGELRFAGYTGGSFSHDSIRVEEGTLAMAASNFNTNIALAAILVKGGATLLQPAGFAHALGGAWTNTPSLTLEEGATYTANQENYLSAVSLTGSTVNGTSDLRSDYGFAVHVYPSSTMTSWSAALNGVVTPVNITVDDGPLAVDFLLSGRVGGTQPMNKTGAGTMAMTAANSTITGLTTIAAGTLAGTAAISGPLAISPGAVIAPGGSTGTFAAGNITLGGTYQCEIAGAACDTLKANGNLTLENGSSIQITASSPTAPVYVIASYAGTFTDNGVTIGGVPAGYEVVNSFHRLMIAQVGLDFNPAIVNIPGTGSALLSSSDFESDNGGFTVSAPVSPETDWTYSAGTWRSNGQNTAFGSNNVSYLTSPSFTLTQSGVFTLTFSHRYSFEFYAPADAYDGGIVEVSINGGPFHKVPASAFTQNGYNGTVMAGSDISFAGQQAFIGNSTGQPAFITSICKAGVGNVGDVVQVRFMSASDNNTSGSLTPQGWEIDSYAFSQGAPGGAMLTWPIGTLQYSDNLEPPWTDLPDAASPWFVDTTLAPRRFFRIKP